MRAHVRISVTVRHGVASKVNLPIESAGELLVSTHSSLAEREPVLRARMIVMAVTAELGEMESEQHPTGIPYGSPCVLKVRR